MKLTKEQLKNFVREVMTEESEYQTFFKKALEKTGKSIPDMSDEEKKEFFNKIDSAWDGKGEKNEGNAFGAAVTAAKKAGEDEFEVGGKTFKVEESTDCGCGSTNESVNEGIDWDELILKAKPGSAIKIDGKFRIKDKYGNWRIVHSWKNRHEDDENDILVNRDIAKIANNKNMKVRKSGSYHIIESVNEISAYSGLSKLVKGETSNVEGINVSKQMADEILKWMSGSPYAKRYKTQIMKQRLGALLPIIFGPFGIEKKLPSNLKGEFTALKNKYSTNEGKSDGGKMAKTHVIYQMNVKLNDNATVPGFRVSVKKGSDAEKRAKDLAKKHFGNEFKSIVSMSKALNPEINNVSEVVTEGRAFINAARKAKQEGKTEFEFNGKTYPVTIKN